MKMDRKLINVPLPPTSLPSSASVVSPNSMLNQISQQNSKLPFCAGCKTPILDRFLLKTMNTFWHEDCLKCTCCDCRLGEVGSSLYTKGDLLLCKRDYLRLFGQTGICSACNKQIPGFELVMKAKGNSYHLECFACQLCNQRFCVGDRFYLHDEKILCEYDYSERLNGLMNNSNNSNNSNTSGLSSQPAGNCASAAMNHQMRNNSMATPTSHISSAQ